MVISPYASDSVLDALIRAIEITRGTKIVQGPINQYITTPYLFYLGLACMEYTTAKVIAEAGSNKAGAIIDDTLTNPRNPDRYVYCDARVGTETGQGIAYGHFLIPYKDGIKTLDKKASICLEEIIEEASDDYDRQVSESRKYTNNVYVPNMIEVEAVNSIKEIKKVNLPIDKLRTLAKKCAQELSKGENYGTATIEVHEEVRRMANSEGMVIRDNFFGYRITFKIEARGDKNDRLVFDYGTYLMGKDISAKKFDEVTKLARWMTREANKRKRENPKFKEGLYPVLFAPDAFCTPLHECLVHFLSSDAILYGNSAIWGHENFGERCTNPKISVYSNPDIPGRWGSMESDDEGVLAKRRVLIEQGKVKGYLADRNGAYHLSKLTGAKILPGDARRGYPRGCDDAVCEPRISNLEIEYQGAVKTSTEMKRRFLQYLKKNRHQRGLVIPMSTRGGCYYENGSFDALFPFAYLVDKNGKSTPVRNVSLNSTVLNFLNQIVEVGGDTEYIGHRCGIDERMVRVGITCGSAIVRDLYLSITRPEGLRQPPLE
ncbi:MAG: TldD/PmbA family protein [Nanoarchaeota archaeon]